jgi:prepilin-type N-terminal cleavage/methylation domain-containing protein
MNRSDKIKMFRKKDNLRLLSGNPIILLKGFTLIELLIVIAIISVLAVVLVSVINPSEMMRKSRDSRRMSDVGTLKRAIDLAKADDQPLTATGGWVTFNSTTSTSGFFGLDLSKYQSVIPQDPAYNSGGGNAQIIASVCAKGSIDKSAISYQYWSDGDTYIIRANMESLNSCTNVQNDGNNNSTYELGTEPGLDAI